MTKQKKLIIGLVSLIPILVVIVTMITVFSVVFTVMRETAYNRVDDEEIIRRVFFDMAGMIVTLIILSMVSLAVLVYFLIHAINNTRLNNDERLVWILLFIFIGVISFPIYWYMRVWKGREEIE